MPEVRATAAICLPRHRRSQLGRGAFSVLSEVTEFFCQIKSKFLNSRVLAGGSMMGCEKKVLVLGIYKKCAVLQPCMHDKLPSDLAT